MSNACEATVVVFSCQLYPLAKLDTSRNQLKWPIGLSFQSSDSNSSASTSSEPLLYICDADNHQIIAVDVSTNRIVSQFDQLQGAAFLRFVTPRMFVTASNLNLKLKFVKTEDDV